MGPVLKIPASAVPTGPGAPAAGRTVDDPAALFFAAAEETSEAVGAIRAVRDAEGRHADDEIVYLNRTIRRRWLDDVALAEIVGRNPYEVIPPLRRFMALSRTVVATREPSRTIEELRKPGETSHWIEQRLEPWGDGFLFFSRDITAEFAVRAAAETSIRESDARLRGALGSLGDSVLVLRALRDEGGRIVGEVIEYANQAWRRAFMGPDAGDPAGRHLDDASPLLAADLVLHAAVIETGVPQRAVLTLEGERWFDVEHVKFGDGIIAVARDVTAAHRAQEALRAREAELAEAQRLAHVGSWTLEQSSGRLTWSDELFRIFGYEPGSRVPSFDESASRYDEESLVRRNATVARALETGDPFDVEYPITRPDGARRHVAVRGAPVRDAAGAIVGLRGTVADMTELRDAQARLDQAERAEMVGRLAGGIAHDFNNLLSVIIGSADFLGESLAADDERRVDVEAILDAGSRAVALTRQLLAFGRRQTLRLSVVDVEDVVVGLAPMLRSLISADVELVLPLGAPAWHVRVDRAQLEQAIVNLVMNARDAMPAGGRLTIETADVAVGRDDPLLRRGAVPGDYVRLSVADTGTGIDPATLGHVFEPFFTTKAPGRGSGLGLSSVEGVVAQSGGFMTVNSRVGTGSVFSIHLPRTRDVRPATPASQARQAVVGGSETVLLVDDQPGVLAITGRTLGDLGYTVVEAGDPVAALALAAAEPTRFDLLITDIVMPGLSGRELADRLAAMSPGLPTLYISGYAPENALGGGPHDPGALVLAKPYTREDLASRVRELLDRRAASHP